MTEPWVPIETAAEHYRVSLSTFRKWVKSGEIPAQAYAKVGAVYRFKLSVLDNFMLGGNLSDPTTPPAEQSAPATFDLGALTNQGE